MTKYHPLYAYAVVSVALILGIQMMLAAGPNGITGFAVGDQQGGTLQGGGQQGGSQGGQGFFQKVGGFFGLGSGDTTGQAGAAGSQGSQQGGTQQGGSQGGQPQQNGNNTGNYTPGTGNYTQQGRPLLPPPGNYTGNQTGNYTGSASSQQQCSGEVQELSEESKSCLDTIDEKIKSCSEDAIQTCLDDDASVECIMKAIGTCMDDYKDDKDSCFEESS